MYDDAMAALQEAVRLKPESELNHYWLGRACHAAKDFAAAAVAFREAVRLKPDDLAIREWLKKHCYGASKDSHVFHHIGCKMAAKIPDKNLVGFATREEAVRAGKCPCVLCEP